MGAAAVIVTGGHGAVATRTSSICCSTARVPRTAHARVAAPTRTAPAARSRRRSPRARAGHALPEARARAQQYVGGAIAHAPGSATAAGRSNHFWEVGRVIAVR
jgi:hypothetical protein